jgi:hypothetical protein
MPGMLANCATRRWNFLFNRLDATWRACHDADQ